MDTKRFFISDCLEPFISYKYLPHQEKEDPTPLINIRIVVQDETYTFTSTKQVLKKIASQINEHFDNRDGQQRLSV